MSARIDSQAALEAVIGKAPPAIALKVIDHLDPGAQRWIAASPLMFAAFSERTAIGITLAGGAPGFAVGETNVLRIPLAALDEPALARPGTAFGSLFLAPGIGETLRVNGTVAELRDGEALVAVEECYVHCAKALIRSDFWSPAVPDAAPGDACAFVDASRFMALATVDPHGHADLSPKGDPAGSMARMAGDVLWFADRPGNRRADSFRNIIAQPRIAAALLLPGSAQVAIIRGAAHLTADIAERARFEVRGKAPLLAVGVEAATIELHRSAAIERARLWPVAGKPGDIDPAKMFVTHVKLNREKGLAARLAGAVMSIPGLMQKGLNKDYRDNLY